MARPKRETPANVNTHLYLPGELLDQVRQVQRAEMRENFSETIRYLIRLGLKSLGYEAADERPTGRT